MSHNNCWNVQMFSRLNWNCHCFITECRDHQSTSVLCNNHNDTDDQQLQDVSLFELVSVWASHNKLWLEFPLTFTVGSVTVQCRIKIAVMKLMSSVHSGAGSIMNQRSGVYHVSSGTCPCKIPQQFYSPSVATCHTEICNALAQHHANDQDILHTHTWPATLSSKILYCHNPIPSKSNLSQV